MKVVNCTPHTVCVADETGTIIRTYEPSGIVARVSVSKEIKAPVDGIPVSQTLFGAVEAPAPEEGTVFIVSTLVAQAANRKDLLSPDTGPTALREHGQVKAVKGFQSFA